MKRQVALLRGVNLGSTNRVAMKELRAALAAGGFEDVATYLQSGNIVLSSDLGHAALAGAIQVLIAEHFELDIPVVVRDARQLTRVVNDNPFPGEAAADPRALQVTFRSEPIDADAIAALEARAGGGEKVAAIGREIYTWHPHGVARSKLAVATTPKKAVATARNWKTVTTLLEMVDGD